MNENESKENNMTDAIGSSQAGTYALLLDTLRAGGRGGGYSGGEGGSYGGTFSNLSSIQHGIQCNRDIGETGIENIQRELANGSLKDLVTQGQNRICDRLANVETRNSDQLTALERRTGDQIAAVISQGHSAEVRNVEQFCTLKSNQSAIEAKIDANKEISEKNSEIQALKTQIQCGCHCDDHHGRR